MIATAVAPPPQPSSSMGTLRRQRAWKTLLEEETLTPRELAIAPRIQRNQPELALEYLAFPPEQREAHDIWLQEELKQVMST